MSNPNNAAPDVDALRALMEKRDDTSAPYSDRVFAAERLSCDAVEALPALLTALESKDAEIAGLEAEAQGVSDFVRNVWSTVLGRSLPEQGTVKLGDLQREIAAMSMREESKDAALAKARRGLEKIESESAATWVTDVARDTLAAVRAAQGEEQGR